MKPATTLSGEFWALADRARSGAAAPEEVRLAALAEASLIDRLDGWERLRLERDRLRRLRDLIAPGTAGRSAQRAVSTLLDAYRRTGWDQDSSEGMYGGDDPIRALCFLITKLSKGRLSARKLQEILTSAQRTPEKLRSDAA